MRVRAFGLSVFAAVSAHALAHADETTQSSVTVQSASVCKLGRACAEAQAKAALPDDLLTACKAQKGDRAFTVNVRMSAPSCTTQSVATNGVQQVRCVVSATASCMAPAQ